MSWRFQLADIVIQSRSVFQNINRLSHTLLVEVRINVDRILWKLNQNCLDKLSSALSYCRYLRRLLLSKELALLNRRLFFHKTGNLSLFWHLHYQLISLSQCWTIYVSHPCRLFVFMSFITRWNSRKLPRSYLTHHIINNSHQSLFRSLTDLLVVLGPTFFFFCLPFDLLFGDWWKYSGLRRFLRGLTVEYDVACPLFVGYAEILSLPCMVSSLIAYYLSLCWSIPQGGCYNATDLKCLLL